MQHRLTIERYAPSPSGAGDSLRDGASGMAPTAGCPSSAGPEGTGTDVEDDAASQVVRPRDRHKRRAGHGNRRGRSGSDASSDTTTPIKHGIVIFQENCSFDHYFGVYPHATNSRGPKDGGPDQESLERQELPPEAYFPRLGCRNSRGFTRACFRRSLPSFLGEGEACFFASGWPQSLKVYSGSPDGKWPMLRRTCSAPQCGQAKRPPLNSTDA